MKATVPSRIWARTHPSVTWSFRSPPHSWFNSFIGTIVLTLNGDAGGVTWNNPAAQLIVWSFSDPKTGSHSLTLGSIALPWHQPILDKHATSDMTTIFTARSNPSLHGVKHHCTYSTSQMLCGLKEPVSWIRQWDSNFVLLEFGICIFGTWMHPGLGPRSSLSAWVDFCQPYLHHECHLWEGNWQPQNLDYQHLSSAYLHFLSRDRCCVQNRHWQVALTIEQHLFGRGLKYDTPQISTSAIYNGQSRKLYYLIRTLGRCTWHVIHLNHTNTQPNPFSDNRYTQPSSFDCENPLQWSCGWGSFTLHVGRH